MGFVSVIGASPPGRRRTSARPPKNSPPYAPAPPVKPTTPVPSGFLLQPVIPMFWFPLPLATPSSVVPALANRPLRIPSLAAVWSPDWMLKLAACVAPL